MFYHSLPKSGVVRRAGRWALRQVRRHRDPRVHSTIERLNPWQEGFCVWNAERLGIPVAESRRRYRASWLAVPGGHGSHSFRSFCTIQLEVFSVVADDSPAECEEAYRLHSWLFLLRQLSLPVPVWPDVYPVIPAMAEVTAPVIVDYGCGLAQTSVSLAIALRAKGATPRLVLADIPTIRLQFAAWLCARLGLAVETVACTGARPLPDFPEADIIVATEIFEHLHEPLPALAHLDAALRPGGFLITNIDDHDEEFMHVCPDLAPLRDRLAGLGYDEVERRVLFRKTARAAAGTRLVAAS